MTTKHHDSKRPAVRSAAGLTLMTLVVGCTSTLGDGPIRGPSRALDRAFAGMARSAGRLLGDASEDLRTFPVNLHHHAETAQGRLAATIAAPADLARSQSEPALRRLGAAMDRIVMAPATFFHRGRALAADLPDSQSIGTSLRRLRDAPSRLAPLLSVDRWPFGFAVDTRRETELEPTGVDLDSPRDRD